MRRKTEMIERDQYGILVATERCSDLIVSHEMRQDGPTEIRLEYGKTEDWDDIFENRRITSLNQSKCHYWQIKRQSTDLKPGVVAGLFRSLHKATHIDMAHLGLRDSVAVKEVGELRVLRDLAIRVNKPGIDLVYAGNDLNSDENRWCEFIRGAIGGSDVGEALLLLKRFEVSFLGDERQIRDLSISRLALLFSRPEVVWRSIHSLLSRSPDGAISVDYDYLFSSVLKGAERKDVPDFADEVTAGTKNEVRAKLKLAQMRARQGKKTEAIEGLEEALALSRTAKLMEEEVEILLALSLLSSSRRRRRGGYSGDYLRQAEEKIREVDSASIRVVYFRAQAAACSDKRDFQGAEEAYRSALECCASRKEDAKSLDVQACVIRSELATILCEQGRQTEATELVVECDAYARVHADDEDSELMQAAMSAGIFWALKTGNEEEAVSRIHELEASAKTAHQADRIGGQLTNMANNSSHMGFHRVALVAAESAVRLAHRSDPGSNLLLGALYTVACMTFHLGDHVAAKRQAESLLDACNNPETVVIKQAAMHLIAEIARGAGDSRTAVAFSSKALALASGIPEEVAFTKQAAARALSDAGRTEEALAHAMEAYELMKGAEIPAIALGEVLLQIVSYASVLGRTEEASDGLNALSLLETNDQELEEIKERAPKLAEMNKKLRERIIEIAASELPQETALEGSLRKANAGVVQQLLDLWSEIPEFSASSYDYWGRGNFARILRNAQAFPGAFNITIEVRTLTDLKQAIRLWSFYVDMLLIIWKGPTEDGWTKGVLSTASEMPGGYGYIAALGTKLKKRGSKRPWYFCMAYASLLPEAVISFLRTEACHLLASGRLIVVPATGVGCVHPGHGPLEQLLTETANAIAGIRSSSHDADDVPIGLIPYSPDAPFELLAEIGEKHERDFLNLRRLLMRRARELAPRDAGIIAKKELAMEIEDALHDLAEKQKALSRKRGMASAKEPISGGYCQFNNDGSRLLPNSIASVSPFAPLLTLRNFGYRWGVGSPSSSQQGRYGPGEESVVGPWLALPTERWSVLLVKKESEDL
jgi:tetratricopeptide (TPR) repeat protein